MWNYLYQLHKYVCLTVERKFWLQINKKYDRWLKNTSKRTGERVQTIVLTMHFKIISFWNLRMQKRQQKFFFFLNRTTFLNHILRSQDDLMDAVKGVLQVENDGLSSLPLTSAETANIPKALYEQTEKERWRKYTNQNSREKHL